jgi:hypothetical protein
MAGQVGRASPEDVFAGEGVQRPGRRCNLTGAQRQCRLQVRMTSEDMLEHARRLWRRDFRPGAVWGWMRGSRMAQTTHSTTPALSLNDDHAFNYTGFLAPLGRRHGRRRRRRRRRPRLPSQLFGSAMVRSSRRRGGAFRQSMLDSMRMTDLSQKLCCVQRAGR